MSLAKARLDWLSTFVPKKEEGELEYKGMPIDADDIIAVINHTSFSDRIISIVTSKVRINDKQKKKTDKTIIDTIQEQFIR